MNGWYKQQRNLSERAWFQDSQMVHLYHFLKERAYVSDGRFHGKTIRRGSCPTTRAEMSEYTGMSPRTIDRILKKLVSYGEIIVRGNNKFSIITICDYDSYDTQESLFGETDGIAAGTTDGIASGTTLIYTKEERIKEDNNLIRQAYKKEREKEGDVVLDIKNRYNKRFAGKLPPCIRLTMPTRVMALECLRRFGAASVDMVFEQVEAESFSMGKNKTGFIASFQFIFDPKNFQGYLERAQLRIQKKQQPQQEKKVATIAPIREAPTNRMTKDERRKSLIELVEYIKENPRSASCTVLEEAYKSGELQSYGINWKPK